MLFGALVTQAFGIEGQVQIQEGDMAGRMTLGEPLLNLLAIDSGKRWTIPLDQYIFPWTGKKELRSDFVPPLHLYLLSDYPKAIRNEKVASAAEGLPALHVSLRGFMASTDEWLLLDHPEKSAV